MKTDLPVPEIWPEAPKAGAGHSIVTGQTRAGKSTLMITLFTSFLTTPEDGESHE